MRWRGGRDCHDLTQAIAVRLSELSETHRALFDCRCLGIEAGEACGLPEDVAPSARHGGAGVIACGVAWQADGLDCGMAVSVLGTAPSAAYFGGGTKSVEPKLKLLHVSTNRTSRKYVYT